MVVVGMLVDREGVRHVVAEQGNERRIARDRPWMAGAADVRLMHTTVSVAAMTR